MKNILVRASSGKICYAVIVGLISSIIGINRANCDKSMKLGENTQFDMRNKIGYRPLLKNAEMCYF